MTKTFWVTAIINLRHTVSLTEGIEKSCCKTLKANQKTYQTMKMVRSIPKYGKQSLLRFSKPSKQLEK